MASSRFRRTLGAVALSVFSVVVACAAILAFDAAYRPWSRLDAKYHEWFFVRDVNHFLEPNVPHWPPTNADGIRSRREARDFPEGGNNLVFLGDSFVWGYNVRENQALPARVEAALNERHAGLDVKAANFGWISASPYVEHRKFGRVGHKYHPKLVVLGLDMTDFHDDIKYELMQWREGIYRYYDVFPLTLHVFREYAPELFWRVHSWSLNGRLPRKKYFASEQPLDQSEPFLEATLRNLEKIDHSARLMGARFVVVVFARGYQHNPKESPDNWEKDLYTVMGPYSREPFRYFEKVASRVGFPIYSLLPPFEQSTEFPLYARDDPHWNHAGIALAAGAVADIVAFEAGWGPSSDRGDLETRVARLRFGKGPAH